MYTLIKTTTDRTTDRGQSILDAVDAVTHGYVGTDGLIAALDMLEKTLYEYAERDDAEAMRIYREAEEAVESAWTPAVQEEAYEARRRGAIKMVKLSNNFHGTTITLRASRNRLSATQVMRSRMVLCGISGCTCGGCAGERGPQVQDDGERIILEALADGGADIKHI